MRHNIIETLVAGAVIIVAALFLLFVLDRTQPETVKSYPLEARFYDAPGLPVGAEVRIAGVQVGQVVGVRLDPQEYVVLVDLMIHDDVLISSDTVAEITYDGLLGDGILKLTPGVLKDVLPPGGRIKKTVAPENVIDQIGHFIYGTGVSDDF